jgi:hypothetical protein
VNRPVTSVLHIDVPLSDEDLGRLEHVLEQRGDPRSSAEVIARAGAIEALALATGRASFSSVSDLRAFRVLCLIEAGMELSEVESLGAAIFKLTPSAARRLVNSAVARYRVELDTRLVEHIGAALEAAQWDREDERWLVMLDSPTVRARVFDYLGRNDLPDATRVPRGPLWRFPDETFQAVRAHFGLAPRAR